jgi:hypothetical protein
LFAANRARLRGWSTARRLVWVAGSPLMPVVRLLRSLPHVRRAQPSGRGSPVSVLALGLVANAAGQMLGYALGPGRATERRLAIDLYRRRDLREREQAELAATPLSDLPRLWPGHR